MIANLSNENADLPDVMNSNRKFDVSLDDTLLWQTESECLCFRGLKRRKYQLPVVIPSVHTGSDNVQVTITSYNIYQTLKLLEAHVVLTLASLDQMVYKPQSSVTIFIKL